MDILGIIKGHVKIKIELSPLADKLLDGVIEPALDELVKDSKSPLDDMLKASIYQPLEDKVKELVRGNILKIQEKIPESLKDFVEIV